MGFRLYGYARATMEQHEGLECVQTLKLVSHLNISSLSHHVSDARAVINGNFMPCLTLQKTIRRCYYCRYVCLSSLNNLSFNEAMANANGIWMKWQNLDKFWINKLCPTKRLRSINFLANFCHFIVHASSEYITTSKTLWRRVDRLDGTMEQSV